MKTQLT